MTRVNHSKIAWCVLHFYLHYSCLKKKPLLFIPVPYRGVSWVRLSQARHEEVASCGTSQAEAKQNPGLQLSSFQCNLISQLILLIMGLLYRRNNMVHLISPQVTSCWPPAWGWPVTHSRRLYSFRVSFRSDQCIMWIVTHWFAFHKCSSVRKFKEQDGWVCVKKLPNKPCNCQTLTTGNARG